MILLLTTFFLCLGAAAFFGPPGWFVEKSSRHQIRTLFLVYLAILPGGHAAKQQSGKEAAALSVSNATAMAPRADPQSWEELTSASASSGTIHLSADFKMGRYTKAIDFSGKVLVIWGGNATLDAAERMTHAVERTASGSREATVSRTETGEQISNFDSISLVKYRALEAA